MPSVDEKKYLFRVLKIFSVSIKYPVCVYFTFRPARDEEEEAGGVENTEMRVTDLNIGRPTDCIHHMDIYLPQYGELKKKK